MLQDHVRLVATAPAAPAAATDAVPSSGPGPSPVEWVATSSMMAAVADCLNWAGPKAAAGDVSSVDALQLFGLLCSFLKVYNKNIYNVLLAARLADD